MSAKGTNPWIVLICLVLASLAEFISMSAMLPALLAVSDEQGALPPALNTMVEAGRAKPIETPAAHNQRTKRPRKTRAGA